MSKQSDLTRWNRAGLAKFRYVNGNAVTLLDTIRQGLSDNFAASTAHPYDVSVSVAETPSEKQHRLVSQYLGERRDMSWEIARSFARSTHVLGEYLDTYANESYLRTATQWSSVKKLVDMLGYQPAPASSAQALLAVMAKPSDSDQAPVLEKGFAVKNQPDDGSPPVIFETLTDLKLDAAINTMRLRDWDRSDAFINYNAVQQTLLLPVSQTPENLSVGGMGFVQVSQAGTTTRYAVEVTELGSHQITLSLTESDKTLPSGVTLADIDLHLNPQQKRLPQLRGGNTITVNPQHGLSAGAVIAWQADNTWFASQVLEVENNRLALSGDLPAKNSDLYLAASADIRSVKEGSDTVSRVIFPLIEQRQSGALFDENLDPLNAYSIKNEDGSPVYNFVTGSAADNVYYLPKDTTRSRAEAITKVKDVGVTSLTFNGKYKGLVSGDAVLLSSSNGVTLANITSIVEQEDGFELLVDQPASSAQWVLAEFDVALKPAGHNQNLQPVFLTDTAYRANDTSTLPLDLLTLPDGLEENRKLILQGKTQAMELTIKEVDEANKLLIVTPAIPGSELTSNGETAEYTRYHSKLYGNVVLVGHGESQPEKILGKGNALQRHQSFTLDAADVSYIADASFSVGVKADIEVYIDGRTWQQVEELALSAASDHHYQLRFDDEGRLLVQFGDGFNGRRLPSGHNNVRARYRTGTGLSGNLAAFSLSKELKPHKYIESVLQPVPASGGNGAESLDSMRDNAPAALLSLKRAVSLRDFDHLTTSHSAVWAAKSVSLATGLGRRNKVQVAVLPAGGGPLSKLRRPSAQPEYRNGAASAAMRWGFA